ncbi:Meiotically up-regulated gene 113 protein [Phlyctema vagabunda]|uniref:Meiotically up-regulated gene 113 protein n=1 Tax=Phlyctema vagabunda TaxID=108571 RepID=A0ABR4PJM1_9HELO
MPFIPGTPESLIPRSDSKNPASTCRGLTSSGRPCRRALAKSPTASPASSSQIIPTSEAFCWQHRDQAQGATAPPQGLQSNTIKERTSVDTLVDRLGILEVSQNGHKKQRRKPARPQDPEKPAPAFDAPRPPIARPRPSRPAQQSSSSLFCCFGTADEVKRPSRPVKVTHEGKSSAPMPKPSGRPSPDSSASPGRLSLSHGRPTPHRPSLGRDPSSRTGEFLSLIPQATSPQTTALLLAELAKPVSVSDDEGFIYMFWLTPESLPAEPPSEAARSLLAPPTRPEPGRRRTSDVLDSFASVTSTRGFNSPDKKTIILKIGRAQNVQRRLNQWTRQCGYNLSLIRYYPYHPSTPSASSPPRTPRKVPNAHKVERLIHIELNGKRVLDSENEGKCSACGREHREWFEVEASRQGVKSVDEVIRRWVDWAEKNR